ncbi:MAG: hypothetical protein A2984_03160 [Omnitrophica WOR_2 bacterium RIFCSPLOWO2_01_FULL_41_12]|nr:MAG: hypothetical protein A2984_03160 [Omnitrophica WOR_2 bacterium RIFCSPLOWO2_01_FULL_41_12]
MINLKIESQMISLLSVFMIIGCATVNQATINQAKTPDYESRRRYVHVKHLKLSSQIMQAILQGRVIEGMTKKDVLATWGKPSQVYGEEWYYDLTINSFVLIKYVRFGINGVVNYVDERR